ncbi:CGCGG family rSAM-modified RiPP protein [Cytobacillus sp. S13-E01]|uniref:CGCGG family putative rSAM-modified RiPP protein n=1 Tax=Cytobacillus sp. S13-E01 TaxID=3031326 RepID=UPI0023D86ADD|nr:CGCGG family rSAM-modified RiPP protein [Cytobacillus sp. S13-E01]MDF0726385.1 CGCGG family rSAM-modified RiPP protein [Cytobacillus sp. S13-E01]
MEKDWSIDLEHGEYKENVALILEDAISAVKQTGSGYFVNLVTPSKFGKPEEYLTSLLQQEFGETIALKYINECGCGGYVLRVWKIC